MIFVVAVKNVLKPMPAKDVNTLFKKIRCNLSTI